MSRFSQFPEGFSSARIGTIKEPEQEYRYRAGKTMKAGHAALDAARWRAQVIFRVGLFTQGYFAEARKNPELPKLRGCSLSSLPMTSSMLQLCNSRRHKLVQAGGFFRR
jgi:hypothetical protein